MTKNHFCNKNLPHYKSTSKSKKKKKKLKIKEEILGRDEL